MELARVVCKAWRDGLERGAPDPGKPRHPAHAAGRAQAETLAETVATLAPALSRVYTSPLCRALETAQCVADRLGCPCTVLTGLREIDFGDWEGQDLGGSGSGKPGGLRALLPKSANRAPAARGNPARMRSIGCCLRCGRRFLRRRGTSCF